MTDAIIVLPTLGSIQSALDEPWFPGKLVVWSLFAISVISWVMIITKVVLLARMRKADRHFSDRLRESKTTLEVFEAGWPDPHSLYHLIYLAGAREASWQLLGSREPVEQMQARIKEAKKMDARQFEFLNLAFRTGYSAARMKLSSGVAGFRFVAATSLFLGLFAATWVLMKGFDQAQHFSDIIPSTSAALGFVVLALLVAGPPVLVRFAISVHMRKRRVELERFRDNLARLFARNFVMSESKGLVHDEIKPGTLHRAPEESFMTRQGTPAFESPIRLRMPNEVPSMDPAVGGTKRTFHSIRERLLGATGDEPADRTMGAIGEQETINPIARQTAALHPVG